MTTWTALTLLDAETGARGLGEALEDLEPAPTGVGVFELEDGSGLWEVGAYFDTAPDEVALALLAAAHGARRFAVSELPETDWVAKVRRDLSPVEAGRFFVHGSHDADRVPEDRVPLLIEASMAFGTGHHGTTLGCLRALDALAADNRKTAVLDLGCGTAVLAMAAAHLWPGARVLASDIDPVAVEVAKANLEANGFAGRIEALEAAGFDAPALAAAAPFDLVIANILKGPLIDLAGAMAAATAPGGHAILSGLLTSQAEEITAHYVGFGYDLAERADIGEWSTLVLVR
ncbi:50S ribosomal protein L11 methyltransferase [Histidinibacterium lentulum]|uniref:Ribosomal protein L11 methyltransferase n=1 Tax=Histidinibacterium lentulum TaxID=2480588 RepID=A0A3N2R126_9RHOB|nr:50S ribosomal protein L11 methyltransferase [Histidinibacterium lentulum]ROU01083.1 methyltransferase domain-containing protein [Histidinibacterium lentulum]